MPEKLTTNFVRSYFEKHKYTLEENFEYVNSKIKINFICPNGHSHKIAWNHFRNGKRCFYCSRNVGTNRNDIIETFEEFSYQVIEPINYINSKSKINFVCPNGHKHSITWNSFKTGNRCAVCSGNNKPSEENIRKSFIKSGYQVIEPINYFNQNTKINFICPNGHSHSISWCSFQNGSRCGKCFYDIEQSNSYKSFRISSILLSIYGRVKTQNKNLTRKQFDEWVKEDKDNIDIHALIEIYNNCPKGFQVDHIIPCSYFDFTDLNQIYHCWKTINLRYLPTLENISRGNRMSYEDFKQLIMGNEKLTNLFFMAQNKPEKLMYQIGCI